MGLWFCHVKGGIHNFNFHSFLSEISIENLRNQGYKVKRIYKKEIMMS